MAEGTKAPLQRVVHTAKVIKSGATLIVPEHLSMDQAIEILKNQRDFEEKLVQVKHTFNVFPWDGALATRKALEERFGFALLRDTMTFFGAIPPAEIVVAISPTEKAPVPWGKIMWPLADKKDKMKDIDEHLYTQTSFENGMVCFQLGGTIKRKWMSEFNKLCEKVNDILKTQSIYKGKAVRIEFTNDHGEPLEMPEPKFMDLSKVNLTDIVYSEELEQIIDTYIMTPLRASNACRAAQIPLKRGVLAAGPYGTGKSLLALAVGKVGTQNGWTFVYIKNAAELPNAIRFAKQYEPCVVFAEDLDRAAGGQDRTEEIDQILNTLDGIDTKADEIMVVLTTNDLVSVNEAMRRPGRLDVVINVTAPDAKAAERLIRVYGRNLIAENADLRDVGELLAGATPAVIRETVERGKLAMIKRTGDPKGVVLPEDLLISARAMKQQIDLLKPVKVVDGHPAKGLIDAVVGEVRPHVESEIGRLERRLEDSGILR